MARQRNIEVSVVGALPIDGYKAVLQKVQEYENDLMSGQAIPEIDSTKGDEVLTVVLTSLKNHEVYVFDITDINSELGNYVFEVVSIGL